MGGVISVEGRSLDTAVWLILMVIEFVGACWGLRVSGLWGGHSRVLRIMFCAVQRCRSDV